jgi:two-component system chemotaxis response regulator CheY
MLQSGGFDLLVTDSHMPGMTGLDLLKAVRADERLATLPVLMITAEATPEQLTEAVQAGASGHIVKPFTAGMLKEQLDKIFERLENAA